MAAFWVSFKTYLIAIAVAFVSSTVRYMQHKRKFRSGELPKEVKKIKFVDWFLFGAVASIMTMSGVALIEYLGFEFTNPMILLIFWVGYMTDYLYLWVPEFLQKQLDKYSKSK